MSFFNADIRSKEIKLNVNVPNAPSSSVSGIGSSGSIILGDQENSGLYVHGNNLYIENVSTDRKIIFRGNDGGTYVTSLTLDMAEAGQATFGGPISCATSLTIGSAVMAEADLEKLDDITDGTAAANKAVVLDGSKNIATIGTIGCGAITSTGTSAFDKINVGGGYGSTGTTISDFKLLSLANSLPRFFRYS